MASRDSPKQRAPHGRVNLASPGSRLRERYEDLGIGRGMGVVRRVRDIVLGRALTMKVLPWEVVDSPRERARFLNEARLTAALQHPGIVPVLDCGELPDGRMWFTMQEVRGRTMLSVLAELHGALRERAPDAPTLRPVIDQFLRACEVVAFAHSQGVVHCDLKPDNIMIGEFGEVLVLNWGLAKHIAQGDPREEVGRSSWPPTEGEGEGEGEGVTWNQGDEEGSDPLSTLPGEGTLAYMSPEQARGEVRRISRATDVYALGSVLFEILAGRPPYVGTANVVWAALLAGPPQPVETVARVPPPVKLAAVCARAMAREQRDRFPDAGALAAEIRGWLDAPVAKAQAVASRIGAHRQQAEVRQAEERAVLAEVASESVTSEATWSSAADTWRDVSYRLSGIEARLDQLQRTLTGEADGTR